MLEAEQMAVCKMHNAIYDPPHPNSMTGISFDYDFSIMPINGLRHPPYKNTNGWFIWASTDFPNRDESFDSIHYAHLPDSYPLIAKFLCLPPGWRFLTDGAYEDVWFDPALLAQVEE